MKGLIELRVPETHIMVVKVRVRGVCHVTSTGRCLSHDLHRQEAEDDGYFYSTAYFLFPSLSLGVPAHGMVPPPFRLDLSASLNLILAIP